MLKRVEFGENLRVHGVSKQEEKVTPIALPRSQYREYAIF